MNEEIWKPIEGFEYAYEISNHGRVRSWLKPGAETRREVSHIMKPCLDSRGYHGVKMSTEFVKDGRSYLVHRLAAKAFIPNPENRRCVNHRDGNKLNNRIENLEWVTHQENIRHAFATGLCKVIKGETIGTSKLTESQVMEIRRLRSTERISLPKLGKMFGISPTQVMYICRGSSWKHLPIEPIPSVAT